MPLKPTPLKLEVVLEGHTAPVRTLAFSRDGTTLASAADDGTARVWDVRRGESTRLLTGHRGPLTLPDRESLAVAMEQRVLIWDVPSGAISPLALERFPHDQLYYHEALTFSPGTRVASAGDPGRSRGAGVERGVLNALPAHP